MTLDERTLDALLATAVADADPGEVMAPMAGPPGWTSARRAAFLRYHRAQRSAPAASPVGEVTYGVLAGSDVTGALRLVAVPDAPEALEVGLWLGRSHRGRGIGRAAVLAGADAARERGARELLARTTVTNEAALAVLRSLGFRVEPADGASVRAVLPLTRSVPRA